MDTSDFRAFADRGFRGSAGIEAPGFLERAVITTADFPTNVQRVPSIQSVPDLGYGVLDLVSTSQMSSGSISFIQDTSPANDLFLTLGNPVPEGTIKPEAQLTFDEMVATARTLAGWVAITRQALEDEPQLQGYINNRLTRALRHVLSGEVLNGTGTAPHLQGILPLAPAIAAGADAFASVAAGIAAVEGAGYNPTGIALNPADWAGFLSSATSGTYGNQVNPFASVTMSVWGIPVVREPNLPAGTALVGDFAAGDTLFYRNDVRILVADQHADLFIKNTLVILAEARAANAVFAPKAFAKVTLPVVP
jgi:HK97 family phage major capsid protein